MSNPEGKARRIAFVVNAIAGEELRAINRDVSRVYTVLTDPKLGMCESKGPPIFGCKSRQDFFSFFLPLIDSWDISNQLVFYFSGHGDVRRSQYCLKLGLNSQDFLPFASLMNELDFRGVHRAILIIDACHSGAAVEGIKDSENIFSTINKEQIPKGIAIIASSQKNQTSHELKDGSQGVFTKLLCDGIETGLDGKATSDGLINLEDIVEYISSKLNNDESYREFHQRPVFSVNKADRSIWLTKNVSGTSSQKGQSFASGYISSPEELKVLYEQTLPNLYPCITASVDELDWELVKNYFEKIYSEPYQEYSRDKILSILKLYSPIQYSGKKLLHKAAVLCFYKRPESIYPQVRSVFVVGNPRDSEFKREEINGSLSYQVEILIEKVKRYIEKISFIDESGIRREIEDIDFDVIRELISNAVTHRNYELTGTTKVTITSKAIEIQSPGRFPPEMSWDLLIQSSTPVSCPVDAAISNYLTHLLVFEGIGRGFDIFKKYIEENGLDSITYTELPGPTTCIHVKRRQIKTKQSEQAVDSVVKKILILSANPSWTSPLRLDKEMREIKEGLRRAKKGNRFSIDQAEAVRYRDIHRAILEYEPHIIHFYGHGSGEEGLVFEDETGQTKLVDAEALAGLFQLFADQVECVVLNACYSEYQARAIAQHIHYVVGMSQAIQDKAAIEFAVGFYDALGADKSYEFAYKLGCSLIQVAGIPQHLIPQLITPDILHQ